MVPHWIYRVLLCPMTHGVGQEDKKLMVDFAPGTQILAMAIPLPFPLYLECKLKPGLSTIIDVKNSISYSKLVILLFKVARFYLHISIQIITLSSLGGNSV